MRDLKLILGMIALIVTSWTGAGYATDQSTAVELCKKSPTCNSQSNGTGVHIWGKNSAGNYEIHCPNGGTCECILCPNPARLQAMGSAVGTGPTAASSADQPTALTGSIVETILKWKLKGKKKVVDAPMEGPTPDPQGGGQPADGGAGADAGAPTVDAGSIGQWHASGTGGSAPIL